MSSSQHKAGKPACPLTEGLPTRRGRHVERYGTRDVKALAAANNPLLAELGIEALKAATDLEQRLKRLEAISNAE